MVVVLVVIAAVLAATTVSFFIAARTARRRLAEATDAAQVAAQQASAQLTSAAQTAAMNIDEFRQQLVQRDADADAGAEVLWSLEQRRTERSWRLSVAPSPEVPSGLAEARHPLESLDLPPSACVVQTPDGAVVRGVR